MHFEYDYFQVFSYVLKDAEQLNSLHFEQQKDSGRVGAIGLPANA